MSSLADIPELIGFFSYSREDDEGSNGALSALRDAIQRELSAQLGRSRSNFRLWQDHVAIAPGRLWETEIAIAVEQSVFFIPMITPRVIRSKHCRFEFESFLAREKALGRADLVFPILYMNVSALEDESQWRNDPLLSIIGARQYVDWRSLRHLDVQLASVREAIERFCSKIVGALETPIPPSARVTDPRILALYAAEEVERAKQRAEDERGRGIEAERLRKEQEERLTAERLAQEERRRETEAERLRKEQEEKLTAERLAQEERRRETEAERLRKEQEERLAVGRRRAQEAADEAARQRAVQRAAAEAAERSRKEHEDNLAAAKRLRETEAEVRGAEGPRERQPSPTWARRVLQAMLLPLLLLLVWQFGSMSKAIDPLYLPAPTDIVANWFARVASGELLGSAMGTLTRFVLGTLIGTVLALAFGKLLVMAPPHIRISLNPLLKFFSVTPAVAFIPLATVVLGLGVATGVAVTAVAIFFPVLAFTGPTANETTDSPPLTHDPAPAMRWEIPFVAALAFSATLASEIGAAGGGLMVKIIEFVFSFNVAGFFAVVLTVGLLAAVIDFGAARVAAFAGSYFSRSNAPRPHAPAWSTTEAASHVPLRRRVVQGAVAPILLIVLWQTAAALGFHHPYLFPSPIEIVAEWFRGFQDIVSHTTSTVLRLIGGVLLSLVPALLLARVMVAQPRLCAFLLPLVRTLGTIPPVIWVPLALLWFGAGPLFIMSATAVGAFFPVLLLMTVGLDRPVDRVGSKSIEPVRGPDMLAGSIAAVRVAFTVLFVAEFTASSTGLGYLMMQEATLFQTNSLFASLLTTGLVGLVLEAGVALMMTRVFGVPRRAIFTRP